MNVGQKIEGGYISCYSENIKRKTNWQEIDKIAQANINELFSVKKNSKDLTEYKFQLINFKESIKESVSENPSNHRFWQETLSKVEDTISLTNKYIDDANDIENIDWKSKISDIFRKNYVNIREALIGKLTKHINKLIFKGSSDNRLLENFSKDYGSVNNLNKMISESPNKEERKFLQAELNKWEKINKWKQKAMETRSLMKNLGGTHLKLKTKAGDYVDGMFIDASKFQEKLINAGGSKLIGKENNLGVKLSGLVFDKNIIEDPNSVVSDLNKFGSLDTLEDYLGKKDCSLVGWCTYTSDTEIYLIEKSDIQRLDPDQIKILLKNPSNFIESCAVKSKLPELSQEVGTAFINSGTLGVYEMHKSDATYFLMRGMNVAFVNPPGYGNSEGSPSINGHVAAVDAMYNYISTEKKIPEEKILIKGWCLGGGPAANIAAKHPNINIVLDQTYEKFSKFILNIVLEELLGDEPNLEKTKEWIKSSKAIELILHLVADTGLFAINDKLIKNNGKKFFIFSDKDTITSSKEFENILILQNKHKKSKDITFMMIPGEHGQNWNEVKENPMLEKINTIEKEITKNLEEYIKNIELLPKELEKLDHNGELYFILKNLISNYFSEGRVKEINLQDNRLLAIQSNLEGLMEKNENNENLRKILIKSEYLYKDITNSYKKCTQLQKKSEQAIGIQAMDRFLKKSGLI